MQTAALTGKTLQEMFEKPGSDQQERSTQAKYTVDGSAHDYPETEPVEWTAEEILEREG